MTAIGEFLDSVGMGGWWSAVRGMPMFGLWWQAISVVAILAGVLILVLSVVQLVDTVGVCVLSARPTEKGQDPHGLVIGVARRWVGTIIDRAAQGHGSGSPELKQLIAGRYEWAGWLLGVLRSTSVMIGLLFTFVGLALALHQLSAALSVADDGEDILATLREVRGALPGLGTAFASSVVGVLVAILIAAFDALLGAWRAVTFSFLAGLSARRLEPTLAPAQGDLAVADLARQLGRIGIVLERVARTNEATATSLRQVTDGVGGLPPRLESATDGMCKRLEAQHAAALTGLNSVLQTAAGCLSDGTATLGEVSLRLAEDGALLEQRVKEAAANLEVSGAHVASLRDAADRFREALVVTQDTVDGSAAIQESMLARVDESFCQIPLMAESVTTAASQTAAAAETLAHTLTSENMNRYLEHLPILLQLAESERDSRLALREAVKSFTGVGDHIEALGRHVVDVGNSAECLRFAYADTAKEVEQLAGAHLLPVLERMVRDTAGEVLEKWSERHAEALTRQGQMIDSQRKILETQIERVGDFGDNVRRLAATQEALQRFVARPLFQRLFGRSAV